jgi:hypothetical protein
MVCVKAQLISLKRTKRLSRLFTKAVCRATTVSMGLALETKLVNALSGYARSF